MQIAFNCMGNTCFHPSDAEADWSWAEAHMDENGGILS
jgi:hypothetical protein